MGFYHSCHTSSIGLYTRVSLNRACGRALVMTTADFDDSRYRYWIYIKGPQIRAASPFAVSLDEVRKVERSTGRTVSRKQDKKENNDVNQRA